MAERTVVVSSLSKSHAAPGFRMGWVIGPPALQGHLFNLLLCMTYGSPGFIQEGALAVLRQEAAEVAALREDYRRRAAMMSALLAEAPNCRVVPPEGGMFVLLDCRGTGLGSEAFALELLEREHVAVLPCDGFGASAAGHLRIALSAPDARLREAGRADRPLRADSGAAAGVSHPASAPRSVRGCGELCPPSWSRSRWRRGARAAAPTDRPTGG